MSPAEVRARHAASQRAYRLRNIAIVRVADSDRKKRTQYWSTLPGRASRNAHQANVRARGYGVAGRLTAADLRAIVGQCHYCGGEQQGWDHVVPLCRGGANTPDNLVPTCRACNKSKGAKTADEFVAWRNAA